MMNDLAERLANETLLSSQEAQTVALRRKGLSWQEIGDEMDVTRGSAQSYYERAETKAKKAKDSVELFKEIGFIETE